jgi:hypothetical protein
MCNFFNALRRHAASTQNVSQEWSDVVEPLRTTEGDDEDGVEHLLGELTRRDVFAPTFTCLF